MGLNDIIDSSKRLIAIGFAALALAIGGCFYPSKIPDSDKEILSTEKGTHLSGKEMIVDHWRSKKYPSIRGYDSRLIMHPEAKVGWKKYGFYHTEMWRERQLWPGHKFEVETPKGPIPACTGIYGYDLFEEIKPEDRYGATVSCSCGKIPRETPQTEAVFEIGPGIEE